VEDVDVWDEDDGRERRGGLEREDARPAFCRKFAERTLARYGIVEPPVAVDRLAARLGIAVRIVELPHGVDARLRVRDELRFIELAAGQARIRHRFSLAHELGHHLLGHRHGESELAERQANIFAGALLVPPTWLRRDVASGLTAEALAARYEVSREVIFIALKDGRLLNKLR
jgi:hypothetical protein